MNPRETGLQQLFDEFANEQNTALDLSALNYPPSTHNFFNFSVHSSHHATTPSTHSSSHHASSKHRSESFSQMLSLTETELTQLYRFVQKNAKLYEIYLAAHAFHNQDLQEINIRPPNGTPTTSSKGSPHHSLSRSKRLAMEELRNCYREVPEIFFRANFTLTNQDIFNQALLIFDLSRSESHTDDLPSIEVSSTKKNNNPPTPKDTDASFKKKQLRPPRLQDNLSHYMDLVEVALLRQIWSRSPAFFRALDDLKGLQYEVHEAIQILLSVRRKLNNIHDRHTKKSLRIPQLSQRQKNEYLLQKKIHYMRQLLEGRNAVLSLLECEDYYSAQELIYSIKDIYWVHLKGIHCMKEIGTELSEFNTMICEVMCNKFATLGIQWEEDSGPRSGTGGSNNKSGDGKNQSSVDYVDELEQLTGLLHRDSSTANPLGSGGSRGLIEEQKNETKKLIQSLLAGEQFHVALNLYRNRLLDGIKLIIRTCVMEYMTGVDSMGMLDENSLSADGDNGGGGGTGNDPVPFVQKIREMPTEHFLSCLSMCFEHLTMSLQKAKLFHEYIVHCLLQLRELKEKNNNKSAQEEEEDSLLSRSMSKDQSTSSSSNASFLASSLEKFDDVIQQEFLTMSKQSVANACEIIQKSIIQLINFRKDINAKFTTEKMIFLWEISLQFVADLESCSGNNAFSIRQCLLMQTKLFLENLHESSKNILVNTLDNERWVQCDVNSDRQLEIDRLASGKAFLLPKASSTAANNANRDGGFSEAKALPSSDPVGTSTGKKPRDKDLHSALVEGHEYKVVWSVLLLIEVILSYLEIAFHFSPITGEIINKIVELIRLFNNRTKQLVLGAQAIQSAARLKSISAKHLAITGQSLQLFIGLLPHIRAALLAQVNPSKHSILSTELDRISQDLFDHHAQIMSKFVNIVSDMIEQSAMSKLKTLDWDRFQPTTTATAAANPPAVPAAAGQPQATQQPTQPQQQQLHSEYFEEIQRNIITLHKVLISILPNEQIQDIFSRIFSLLNRKLVLHFEEIMPNTATGKQRILDELTYFISSLSRLKAVDATILMTQLEENFRKKYGR
jgi:vacuolar protein sorting-associated protein 54